MTGAGRRRFAHGKSPEGDRRISFRGKTHEPTNKMNQITEVQVVAFLRERCSEITAQTGIEYVSVKADVTTTTPDRIEWTVYAHGCNHTTRPTVSEAIEQLVSLAAPFTELQKRRAAASLLAYAEVLQRKAGEILATLPVITPNPETSAP